MRFTARRNMRGPVDHLHNSNSFDAISVSGSDGSSGRFTVKNNASMQDSRLSSTCFSTQTTSTASGRLRVARLRGGGRWRGPEDSIGDGPVGG
ncbi:hypothetical protein DAI22_11g122200 [Oryza sativa Japonica Group]|nr:hypothetical protein DAI22_11g122200 [Oryza sativa Japonica Group]